MTTRRSSRLAGFMFLFYIATAAPEMALFARATAGKTTPARVAAIAQHLPQMRASIVLATVTIADALLLGIALYALTRSVDPHLALLALLFRAGEGITGALALVAKIGLLRLALDPSDTASINTFGTLLLNIPAWTYFASATLFAAGSTIFAALFLRARTIPVALAWLGLVGSVLVLIGSPLEMIRLIHWPMTGLIWIPIALFEITFGFWLLFKGVRDLEIAA